MCGFFLEMVFIFRLSTNLLKEWKDNIYRNWASPKSLKKIGPVRIAQSVRALACQMTSRSLVLTPNNLTSAGNSSQGYWAGSCQVIKGSADVATEVIHREYIT